MAQPFGYLCLTYWVSTASVYHKSDLSGVENLVRLTNHMRGPRTPQARNPFVRKLGAESFNVLAVHIRDISRRSAHR